MLAGIDRGASALLLLQGSGVSPGEGAAGADRVMKIVAETAQKAFAAPASTGPKARLQAKVVENALNTGIPPGGNGGMMSVGQWRDMTIATARREEAEGSATIAKGGDADWENAVSSAEWNMKMFLNILVRHNGGRLVDEAVDFYVRETSDAAARNPWSKVLGPKEDDVEWIRKDLKRDTLNEDRAGQFEMMMNTFGLRNETSTDERGVVRIRTGDYSMADGTRYLRIGEDGSMTTYNKDGSIRRHETLEDLMTRAFSETSARSTAAWTDDGRRYLKMF